MEDEFELLVLTYLAETERLLVELSSAASATDHDRVRRTAHSLKSASANIGATALAKIAGNLEETSRSTDIRNVTALVSVAREQFEQVRSSMEQILTR
jgi:HPt (histidine-containing phosphotransfer) domain-containing protein